MRKLLLTFSLVLFAGTALMAQDRFRAGVSGGIPVGDAGDVTTFAIALDLAYILEISEDFEAGPMAGFHHLFGDSTTLPVVGEVDFEDISFLPIGGTAGYYFGSFGITLDLGYGIGISDGNDGGFYWAPGACYRLTEMIDIVTDYRSVAVSGGSIDWVSFGIEFNFN